MNREQVIEWARSLHLIDFRDKDTDPAIVDVIDSLIELVRIAQNQEREACAQVCDEAQESIWQYHDAIVKETGKTVCENLAKRIRARDFSGNQE